MEAKIRRLVNSNIIGIFIWNLDGRIVDANEAFLRIVGYGRDDLASGQLRWMETDARRMARGRRPTRGRAEGDRDHPALSRKNTSTKDGSRVPVLVGAVSFEGRSDEGVAFVLDLTDRKRAEWEARESERRYHEAQMELAHANRVATMGQLSASIAHEVNQPIAAAVNNASCRVALAGQTTARSGGGPAGAQSYLSRRQSSQRRHRPDPRALKKAPPTKEDLDINEAILEVIGLTRGEVTKNGISVQTQLAEGLPLIHGDRVQLQQVILNLIINAVEAMSAVSEGPRELLISTGKTESDGVLVAVRDSGPGLTPANFERLFDAFYTTKPGGLGMGLSICRSIIEAHGGRLWASANVPRGAAFQFTVPVHPNRAS